MAGAAGPFGFEGVAARPRSGRQLPAGAPLLQRGGHPVPQEAECRQYGEKGQEKQLGSPGTIGIGAGAVRIGEEGGPYSGGRDDQADARLGGRPGQRPAADRAGGRADPAAAEPAGMSAVSAARSAQVRAVSAWPARASSSSLVSRPCTNAVFSVSITCSRSAWPALSRSPAAAAGSCGPVITGTSPARTMQVERSAAAPCRPSSTRVLARRTAALCTAALTGVRPEPGQLVRT
jgi:hypothetical protein